MQKSWAVTIRDLRVEDVVARPPGSSRVWEALQQGTGEIKCRASTLVCVEHLSGTLNGALSEESLGRGLVFPGLQNVEAASHSGIRLQIRKLGREPDALSLLVRERLEREHAGAKFSVWSARQYEFEETGPVQAALTRLVELGLQSGLFHPSFEQARVLVADEPIEWPLPGAKVGDLKEAYQKAYLEGYWSALHRNYRIQERRPRSEPDLKTLRNPLVEEFQTAKPGVDAPKASSVHGAPLHFVVGLPDPANAGASAALLREEIARFAALQDRGVGAVHLRAEPTPLMTIAPLPRLPLNQRALSTAATEGAKLFMLGPWDEGNPVLERRVEVFAREIGSDLLAQGELVDGEQDLVLYFMRILAREPGWSVRSEDAIELVARNSRKALGRRAWFFWGQLDPKVFLARAAARGIPALWLGERRDTGRCEFLKAGANSSTDSFKISLLKSEPQDLVEVAWEYPEVKSPTYGYDKASVFPDQYLLKVTARSAPQKEWALQAPAFASAERFRSVITRRSEADAVSYLRWTDGQQVWAESVGTKSGWMDVDPKSAGAAAADAAIRGLLAAGAQPHGGAASVWTTQPLESRNEKIEDHARAWGAYILSLEGAFAYLKQFNHSLESIEGAGPSFARGSQEILVKLRGAVPTKVGALVPGFRMVGEVLYAIGPRPAFMDAGSRVLPHVRVVSNHVAKLVPAVQAEIYQLIHELIMQGKVTCIRPIGEGGIMAALGEMALWGGIGAQIRPNLPVIELFSASPGRFVLGILPSEAKNVESRVKSELLTPLGTTGGEKILGLTLSRLFEERGAPEASE